METTRVQFVVRLVFLSVFIHFFSTVLAQHQVGISSEFRSLSHYDYGVLLRPWMYGYGAETARFEALMNSKLLLKRDSLNLRAEELQFYQYAFDFPRWSLLHTVEWNQDQDVRNDRQWKRMSLLSSDIKARLNVSIGTLSLALETGPAFGMRDKQKKLVGYKNQLRTLIVFDQYLSAQAGMQLQHWAENRTIVFVIPTSFAEVVFSPNEHYDVSVGASWKKETTVYVGVSAIMSQEAYNDDSTNK